MGASRAGGGAGEAEGDMPLPVTAGRVDDVRRQVDRALNLAADPVAPDAERDAALERACGAACGLLGDCLAQGPGILPEPGADPPLSALIRDNRIAGELQELLGGAFAAALRRTAGDDDRDPAALVAAARAEVTRAMNAARTAARRSPRKRAGQVREESWAGVGALRQQVCEAAGELSQDRKDSAQKALWRGRALKALGYTASFLLTLSVTMAGPHVVLQDLSAWLPAQVILIHHLGAAARSGVAPPRAGLTPR
jgi:hypothetical protein